MALEVEVIPLTPRNSEKFNSRLALFQPLPLLPLLAARPAQSSPCTLATLAPIGKPIKHISHPPTNVCIQSSQGEQALTPDSPIVKHTS
jgi:hypothetical protein